MKKNITSVIISFLTVAVVTTASTFLYQKQVYAAEQLAIKQEKERQIVYEKEQERLAFVAELERVAEVARLEQEEKERREAEAKALEEARIAEEERIQEEARIASIANEVARQEATRVAALEVQRQADLLATQQKAQDLANQLIIQKAQEAKLAAEAEEKVAADKLAAKKKSRRSRAS